MLRPIVHHGSLSGVVARLPVRTPLRRLDCEDDWMRVVSLELFGIEPVSESREKSIC